jgi:uncharacterized repeat protein (TIGR01451 family)
MTFIGNTLGLAKALCENEPGTSDGIGAFITTNPADAVGSYPSLLAGPGSPAGTTLTWQNNMSSAVYTSFPAGTMILHAELIWGGSYGFYCQDGEMGVDPSCVLDYADGPVTFITPDNVVHLVTADPETAGLNSQIPTPTVVNNYCAGYYARSQDVTALFTALIASGNLNGTYSVGGVPATVSPFDNTENAAGWTLAVVYTNPTIPEIYNISLFVSNQEGDIPSEMQIPAAVTGFCTPSTGTPTGRILISCLEGDANKAGDSFLFGPTNVVADMTKQFGPNNLINNFFASQINGDDGLLLNTTGTFCAFNSVPPTITSGARQGYDITNIPIAPGSLTNNQTSAYAIGITQGDDYMIDALGLQISVTAPVIIPIKFVNGMVNYVGEVGDTVTFEITMFNNSTVDALDVVFTDVLESGLVFVPNSFTCDNGCGTTNPDLSTGVSLGTISAMQTVNLTYQVQITTLPPTDDMFINQASASFDYDACSTTIPGQNSSNVVTLEVTLPPPSPPAPEAPSNFAGVVKKCKFLNKNQYSLKASWTPSPSDVVSYRILKRGKIVATIPAAGPYVFETCLKSRKEAGEFSIVSVSSDGRVSEALKISVTNE